MAEHLESDDSTLLDDFRDTRSEAATEQIWISSLRRLAQTGGDWQDWLKRLPKRPSPFNFEQELGNEAKLMEALQRGRK